MFSKDGIKDEAYESEDNTSRGKYEVYANQSYVVVVEHVPCCTIVWYSTCAHVYVKEE